MTLNISISYVDWEAINDNGKTVAWRCIVCRDGRMVPYEKTHRHETSGAHIDLVELMERQERLDTEELAETQSGGRSGGGPLPSNISLIDSGMRTLLQSLGAGALTGSQNDSIPDSVPSSDPDPNPGWAMFEAYGDTNLALSAEDQGIALLAKGLLQHFDEVSIGSEDDGDERSDDDANNEIPEPIVTGKQLF
jgi:hypothetical protein